MDPRSFFEGARHARKREVFEHGPATLGKRHDVVEVKRRFLRPLRQQAILAQIPRPAADLGGQVRRNVFAHGDGRRATAARAFITASISTSSVSA